MSTEPPRILQRFGARGARVALIGSATVFLVLLGAWSAHEILAALRAGLAMRGILIGLGSLLLLLVALRVMSLNWWVTRPIDAPWAPPDPNEQTGIWGVGGPSMREPGTTGVYRAPIADRRYENRDE
ncbi:MAG TPA: hypothetical protein VK130_03295 [Steroidobacteraceae bacterium]|nr:hypothetical protein [Steroidobacteraceae bacterium]